ncbi:MAG: UDP-3-O-acyl-N-acetylglucosamine deacetylase [Alphaproteobacteria bacterium]|nr:UDP-3-O-acyl-N-acetylglucosamine deacetylase [Alphaproteobacteria bacterium]
MDRQQTITQEAGCTGVGLHTGQTVRLTLRPAGVGEGVRFVRTDVRDRDPVILAHALNVSTTQLGTNLTNGAGVSVATVEHLLAACSGMGVDNLVVELEGPEAPILDGSSAPFCRLIERAGPVPQEALRRRLQILKTVEIREGAKIVRLSPGSGLQLDVTIDFASRAIGRQKIVFTMKPGAFARDIASARTFGFAGDVEKLRSMGLARGGSMDNAIVVDGDRILNPDGLQTEDEFVRHKLLDVIGDLFLAGGPIEGHYEGEQPGHALNNRLLRAVLADPDASAWVTSPSPPASHLV